MESHNTQLYRREPETRSGLRYRVPRRLTRWIRLYGVAMSGDELASALYAEQGFVVIAGPHPVAIGTVVRGYPTALGALHTPLRVIGDATAQDFRTQRAIAARVCGCPQYPVIVTDRFYRAEPCD